ncbi:Basic Leucine Zipper Transcriptional Factor Atf-Like 2 [Manis pentadactyla]|nr:Basic Leucine Zipper Transcriptional Factor Atf-Like 2 [Manis pentadactyla]
MKTVCDAPGHCGPNKGLKQLDDRKPPGPWHQRASQSPGHHGDRKPLTQGTTRPARPQDATVTRSPPAQSITGPDRLQNTTVKRSPPAQRTTGPASPQDTTVTRSPLAQFTTGPTSAQHITVTRSHLAKGTIGPASPQDIKKPFASFSTDAPKVLVCLWPSGHLLDPAEMAGRGCYLVEEKFLTPVLMHPVTKMSPKSVSPAGAENEDSGLRDLPSPSGSLGPSHISQSQVVPLRPESDAWAPGTPPSLPGSSDCVRNSKSQEPRQEVQPESDIMGYLVPDTARLRLPALGDLHLPEERPSLGVSVKAVFTASVPSMLQNVTVLWLPAEAWPVLGAVQRAVPLVDHCAKMLLGLRPEDLWSGISFSLMSWGSIIWGLLFKGQHRNVKNLFLTLLSRKGKNSPEAQASPQAA